MAEINQEQLEKDFITASKEGNKDNVLKLIKKGVNINCLDENGKSAIYHAFKEEHSDIVNLLKEKGADLYITLSEDIANNIKHAGEFSDRKLSMGTNELPFIIDICLILRFDEKIQSVSFKTNTLIFRQVNFNDDLKYLARILKTNTSIKSLNLSTNSNLSTIEFLTELSDALKISTSLESLNLNSLNIRDESMKFLSEAIKMSKLKQLDLSNNNIGSKGAVYLEKALENPNLIYIDLTDTRIGNDGVKYLSKGLKNNSKQLKSLSLNNNGIENSAINYLVEAIIDNKELDLKYLGLKGNKISAEGAKSLAKLLKNNRIQALNLNLNNLKDDGVEAICNGLIDNHSLQSLSLSRNVIKLSGAEYIANALKVHPTLQVLDISSNFLYSDGAITIANALERNHNLLFLNVMYNRISTDGYQALAQTFRLNTKLQSADISEHNPNGHFEKDLISGITNNHKLLSVAREGVSIKSQSISKIERKTTENLAIAKKLAAQGDPAQLWDLALYNSGRSLKSLHLSIRLDKSSRTIPSIDKEEAINYLSQAADKNHILALKSASDLFRHGMCWIADHSIIDRNIINIEKAQQYEDMLAKAGPYTGYESEAFIDINNENGVENIVISQPDYSLPITKQDNRNSSFLSDNKVFALGSATTFLALLSVFALKYMSRFSKKEKEYDEYDETDLEYGMAKEPLLEKATSYGTTTPRERRKNTDQNQDEISAKDISATSRLLKSQSQTDERKI